MPVEQGAIYDDDFGARDHGDHRMLGPLPALVVQSAPLNALTARGYPLTVVVPMTSTRNASPTVVEIAATDRNGLDHTSYALCHHVFTIRAEELVGKTLRGMIDRPALYRVKQALTIVFGMES